MNDPSRPHRSSDDDEDDGSRLFPEGFFNILESRHNFQDEHRKQDVDKRPIPRPLPRLGVWEKTKLCYYRWWGRVARDRRIELALTIAIAFFAYVQWSTTRSNNASTERQTDQLITAAKVSAYAANQNALAAQNFAASAAKINQGVSDAVTKLNLQAQATSDLAQAAGKQAEAAGNQATATSGLASDASGQLKTMQKQLDDFEDAQSAQLVFDNFKVDITCTPAGTCNEENADKATRFEYNATYSVENVGPTIAKGVISRFEEGRWTPYGFTGCAKMEPIDEAVGESLVPNQPRDGDPYSSEVSLDNGTGKLHRVLTEHENAIVIIIHVEWNDIFHRTHDVAACRWYNFLFHEFRECTVTCPKSGDPKH